MQFLRFFGRTTITVTMRTTTIKSTTITAAADMTAIVVVLMPLNVSGSKWNADKLVIEKTYIAKYFLSHVFIPKAVIL